jgi:hypothetical protein
MFKYLNIIVNCEGYKNKVKKFVNFALLFSEFLELLRQNQFNYFTWKYYSFFEEEVKLA